MNNQNTKNIKWMKYWKKYLAILFVAGALVFSVSLMLPIRYQANSSVLITQKDAAGLDAYKEVKSAEFTGKIVGQVILSNAFMESVTGQSDPAKRLLTGASDPEDRLKTWRKAVRVDQVSNTGVLNLAVLAGSREDAKSIMETIVAQLGNDTQNFLANPQIGIKVVNQPYYLGQPAYPQVIENTVFTLVIILAAIILAIQMAPAKFQAFLESNWLGRNKKSAENIYFFDQPAKALDKENLRLGRLIQLG